MAFAFISRFFGWLGQSPAEAKRADHEPVDAPVSEAPSVTEFGDPKEEAPAPIALAGEQSESAGDEGSPEKSKVVEMRPKRRRGKRRKRAS